MILGGQPDPPFHGELPYHPGHTSVHMLRQQQTSGCSVMFRQISRSTSAATRSAEDAEAVGTATIMRAGPEVRILCIAASMVNPDASPSSTRMVVFPARSGNGLPLVNRAIRSCTFFLVKATAASTSPCDSPSASRNRSLINTCPSQVIAPKPASVLPGICIFLTIAEL